MPSLKKKSKPASHPPVAVALPNTIARKMEAIVNLSQAVRSLAKSLESVNVRVEVSNCHIENAAGDGINITTSSDAFECRDWAASGRSAA